MNEKMEYRNGIYHIEGHIRGIAGCSRHSLSLHIFWTDAAWCSLGIQGTRLNLFLRCIDCIYLFR